MFPDRFNLAHYLLDGNLERGLGDKVALRWRDEAFTYAQLVERSGRLARAFRELGLRMEERVLFACSDRPEFVDAWFATLKAGAVFAMVNPLQDEDGLLYALQYTRARIAVIDAELSETFERLAAKSPHLEAVVVCGGATTTERPELASQGQHLVLDLVAEAPAPDAPADTHRHDVAGWLFTSGSTGRPKAAVHFHEDFAYNVEHYAKGVLGIQQSDVTAGVPKLFFGYATGTNLMFPFAVGATAALFSERSTPEVVCDVVETYRPTILTSVPTMIGRMLALEAEHGARDLSSLRLVLSAGEKLPEALQRQWMERCGVEILDGIGSAELFHIYISNRPGQVRPGSLGLAVPGYECKVVDEQGAELPRGEVGRLFVRGRSAAQGYWHDREKSIATFAGELVMTADLFRQDDEGWFFFEGRADELLKVGGRFVAPHEVEDALLAHPSVAEAAVVGWKDAEGLVKPRAWVVLTPEAKASAGDELERELQSWVKERLSPHKYPRKVTFVDELPKNDRGKVDRKAIRAVQDAGEA